MSFNLALVALAVFLLNLPCGWWRRGVPRFSLSWVLAVHLPIPFVIGLRLLSGIGFHWSTYPVLVAAYMAGQYLGARWRRSRRSA